MDDELLLREFTSPSKEPSKGEQIREELLKNVLLMQEIILFVQPTDFEEYKDTLDNLVIEIGRLTEEMFKAFKKEKEEKEGENADSSNSEEDSSE